MQVQFIRFPKKYRLYLLLRSEGALGPFYVYILFARWQQLATNKLKTIPVAAPLATLTRMNALEMDSEGRIVEVVLGTEFLTMTDERAMIKLGLKTGAGSSHGKSVQATIRFVIQPVILHSVYDSRSTHDCE